MRFHALTSLRFVLAFLVVYAHCGPLFGLRESGGYEKFLPCMSAFFILSGFVLRYRYPGMAGKGLWRYYLARVARLWPVYLATLGLFVLLVPAASWPVPSPSPGLWLTNLTLTQVWAPSSGCHGSLNKVAWSTSTEVFFYLCFPFLVWNWRRAWPRRLALAVLLPLGLVYLASHHPALVPPKVSVARVLYEHPLARLWEFVLGMVLAEAWQRFHPYVRLSRRAATVLEIMAVGLTLGTALSGEFLAAYLRAHLGLTESASTWLVISGLTAVPLAILLFVLALGQGHLSRCLAAPVCVFLGETSYSLYLVHYPLLMWVSTQPAVFARVSGAAGAVLFFALTAAAAYLLWALIETPCRRGILALWDRWQTAAGPNRAPDSLIAPGSTAPQAPRKRQAPLTVPTWRRALVAAVVLVGIGGWMFLQIPRAAPLESLSAVRGQAQGGVDRIAGVGVPAAGPVVLSRGQLASEYLQVEGWAATTGRSPVLGVYLTVDDDVSVWTAYGASRKDVVDHFGSPQCLHTGYTGILPRDRLGAGAHSLSVHAVLEDNKSVETLRTVRLVVQ